MAHLEHYINSIESIYSESSNLKIALERGQVTPEQYIAEQRLIDAKFDKAIASAKQALHDLDAEDYVKVVD